VVLGLLLLGGGGAGGGGGGGGSEPGVLTQVFSHSTSTCIRIHVDV
jgi:hypothetical protein